jgi:hypothetical protein
MMVGLTGQGMLESRVLIQRGDFRPLNDGDRDIRWWTRWAQGLLSTDIPDAWPPEFRTLTVNDPDDVGDRRGSKHVVTVT